MSDQGSDHVVELTADGAVLRRRRREAGGLSADREAELLALVAPSLPVPVPRVGRVVDEDTLVLERLPGVPLLDSLPAAPPWCRARLGSVLGRVIAALAMVPVERVASVVPVDDAPHEEYVDEAAALVRDLGAALPADRRGAVLRFLSATPPRQPPTLVLCHHDLGAENLLVDPDDLRITGVLDWSDAAITDPALDLGLVLRDLGRAGFEHAVAAVTATGIPLGDVVERAEFHARVRALEDLAFGVEHDLARYRDNALRAIGQVFDPTHG